MKSPILESKIAFNKVNESLTAYSSVDVNLEMPYIALVITYFLKSIIQLHDLINMLNN